ncbi:MAG: CotH kinase family protein [Vicinamibacterales bacterium]
MTSTRVFVAALAMAGGLAVTKVQGQSLADLFNPAVLHRIDLNLHSSDWAKLKQNFQINDYYPADVTWNGQTVRNIGIRSRGAGSRSGVKPGLRVDIDRYATTQLFLGLKAFVLRNQTQDASGIHETTAMWLYARMGIPAPRTSHARLYVNGQYAGLYVIVEEIDKKFLARVFGIVDENIQNDGHLYEYDWIDEWRFSYLGSGLEAYKQRFSPKTHESRTDEDLYRPIETLVRLTNETPTSGLVTAIADRLDLSLFMRYLAVQTFLAENDGFAGNWAVNNFYLYRLEDQAKHVFIPWDASNAFWGPRFDVTWRFETNVLVTKLMQIAQFRDTFFASLNEAADVAGARNALDTEIRRELDLIDSAVREDTLKPFSDSQFVNAGNLMRQFSGERVAYVKCEVARLTGQSSNSC